MWEVPRKCHRGNDEEAKGEAESSAFAWEVLEKVEEAVIRSKSV